MTFFSKIRSYLFSLNFSGKSSNLLFSGFYASIFLSQLLALPFNPLPWFDEVFFVDISSSVLANGQLNLPMMPNLYSGEILIYGPVYFYLQALILKLAGLGAFQFRFLSFASGCILVLVFRRFLRRHCPQTWISDLFPLVLFINPIFLQSIHSGRMDLFATLFCFLSFVYVYNSIDNQRTKSLALAGFFAAIAFLSTPRTVFVFIPLCLLVPFYLRFRHFFSIAVFFFCFGFPILLWFVWKFPSLDAYLALFRHESAIRHIGVYAQDSVFFRYPLLTPFYGLVLISTFSLFSKKLFSDSKSIARFAIFGIILLFHILVVEKGPYTAMVMVFYLLFIALGFPIAFASPQGNAVFKTLTIFSFGVYFMVQLGKFAVISATLSDRLASNFSFNFTREEFAGKRIVASFEYYYLLKDKGLGYCPYEIAYTPQMKLKFHMDTFQTEYLFINQREVQSHTVREYLDTGKFEFLRDIESKSCFGCGVFGPLLAVFPPSFYATSYRGKIYKRVKK